MKKITVYAAMLALVFASCTHDSGEKAITLSTQSDSLCYAASMYMAENLPRIAQMQLGIDSAHIDDFVRGIRDGFPTTEDAATKAYTAGLQIASRASGMLLQAENMLYNGDTTKHIDRRLFIEAVVASLYNEGKTMKVADAVKYFNEYKYRGESERFMLQNATRDGIVTLPDGLQYKMEQKGDGTTATMNDSVMCIYKGSLTNGRSFDSSRGKEVKFPVNSVIPGFAKALCMLPEGSKCKVYIPWNLAYGEKGSSRIPPYSTLVFDIEVTKVIKKK